MLFDLKSGKRRRVVQVVFGFLAFIFFISFVGFGIGSDVSGGIFDAIGLGGGDNSGSDPQYEQQIEDAETAIGGEPGERQRLRRPDRRLLRLARRPGSRSTRQTGQQSISTEAQIRPPAGGAGVGRLHRDQAQAGRRDHGAATRSRCSSCSATRRGPPRPSRWSPTTRGPPPPTPSSRSTSTPTARSSRATRPASRRSRPPTRPTASRSRRRSTPTASRRSSSRSSSQQQQQEQGGQEAGEQQLNDPFGDLGGGRRPGHPDALSRLATDPGSGPLAQLVEQETLNLKVTGSIPVRPT